MKIPIVDFLVSYKNRAGSFLRGALFTGMTFGLSACSLGSWSQDKKHLIDAPFTDLNKVPPISVQHQKCLKEKLIPQYRKDLKEFTCQQKEAQERIKGENLPPAPSAESPLPPSPSRSSAPKTRGLF